MSAMGDAFIAEGERLMRARGHALDDVEAWDGIVAELLDAPDDPTPNGEAPADAVVGYSGSGSPASLHAADPRTRTADHFARALCRSGLWVLIDHGRDGTPLLAAGSGGEYSDTHAIPGCLRCLRKIDKRDGLHP